MAGFNRISGGNRGFRRLAISSITVVLNDVLMYDYENEVVILATSSATPERLAGICVEAASTSDTTVLVQKIEEDDEYTAATTSNTATTDDLHRNALTDENAVANGADVTGDTGVFQQLGIVGATTDNLIRGRFITRQDRAA